MHTQHVMVDLETLGKGSYAPILSIGAAKFDPLFPDGDYICDATDTFQVFIDLESSMKVGMRPDASTIMWWLSETQDEARSPLMRGLAQAVQLDEALIGFADWYGDDKPIWGNGATFDNVILSNAYLATGIDRPWSYKSDRCFRTLKELKLGVPKPEAGNLIAHSAVDDAIFQVCWLREIVQRHCLHLE